MYKVSADSDEIEIMRILELNEKNRENTLMTPNVKIFLRCLIKLAKNNYYSTK